MDCQMHDAYQNTGEYKKKLNLEGSIVSISLCSLSYLWSFIKKHFSYTFLCYSENLVYSAVEYLVLFSRKSKGDKERILRVQ